MQKEVGKALQIGYNKSKDVNSGTQSKKEGKYHFENNPKLLEFEKLLKHS